MFSRDDKEKALKVMTDQAVEIGVIAEPDLPEITTPIEAWRCWILQGGLLYSSYRTSHEYGAGLWSPRVKFEAACGLNYHNPVKHRSPDPDCTCGIYGGKTELKIQMPTHSQGLVWGKVALWGRVLEQSGIYRAEFAYPSSLIYINQTYTFATGGGGSHTEPKFTPKKLAEKLETLRLYYGVPVTSGSYDEYSAAQAQCYRDMGVPEEIKGLLNG